MKQITLAIDLQKEQVSFSVNSTSFVPDYLKYLLEYKEIPDTYQLCFLDKTYKNIEEFKNERNII